MGESKRKKLAGNTEPSNPKWRKYKKFTRKMEQDIESQALSALLGMYYPKFPPNLIEVINNEKRNRLSQFSEESHRET